MKLGLKDVPAASWTVLGRLVWSTPQRRRTTSFVLGALVLMTVFLPPIGIATRGGAFAGWWIAVFIGAVLSGLVGNRIGVAREKSVE
ncbi:MAG: hypothetical protein ABL866_13290 [Devosia sp.]